jgi:hypothetical protein
MKAKSNPSHASPQTTQRSISSAEEIHHAAQRGSLKDIPPEMVVKWIRSALDAEDLDSKIAFIKERILKSAANRKADKSPFTAGEIAPEFRHFTNGSTVGIITAALLELSEEGKLATLDPGRAPIYRFN